MKDGVIIDSSVDEIEPLGDEMPEKITEPELAKDRAVLIEPPAEDDDVVYDLTGDKSIITDSNKGKDMSQSDGKDKGNDKDEGNDKDDDKDKGNDKDEDKDEGKT